LIYLDASFLVALYTPDKKRSAAAASVAVAKLPLLVSPMCEFEAVNAFRLRVFRKHATHAEAQASIRDLEFDFTTGSLRRVAMPPRSFARAHQLSMQHTAQLGTRGTDLLHVAIALELKASEFFGFDVRQRTLASNAGLNLNAFLTP
jgi:predicted nucleic acid-binding protein